MKKEIKIEAVSVLARKEDGVLTAIWVKDDKTHHNVAYTVSEAGFEELQALLNGNTI